MIQAIHPLIEKGLLQMGVVGLSKLLERLKKGDPVCFLGDVIDLQGHG